MLADPTNILFDPDGSINYVWSFTDGESLEAREVSRNDGAELIVYISSQTGCEMTCRMCHLTQTGQNKARNAVHGEMVAQADRVLWEATRSGRMPEVIHFNFMARGEPLLNPAVDDTLFDALRGKVSAMFPFAHCKFKVSTIFPEGVDAAPLVERFGRNQPDIYYSLWGVNPEFRKKWFPRAEDPHVGLGRLVEWQAHTNKIPRLHLALIKGENDNPGNVNWLIEFVNRSGVHVNWNIVRFNPYPGSGYEEGDWQGARDALLASADGRVQVVDRVGPEVAASCGMFVGRDGTL